MVEQIIKKVQCKVLIGSDWVDRELTIILEMPPGLDEPEKNELVIEAARESLVNSGYHRYMVKELNVT